MRGASAIKQQLKAEIGPQRFLLPLLFCLPAQAAVAKSWDSERPTWMPDGRIVYSVNRRGNWDLAIVNGDGSNQTLVTDSKTDELFPAVSPDGRSVAFVRDTDGNYDIWVLSLADRRERRLTTHPAIDDWPSWADNGNTIVFDSDRSGSWGIYRMRTNGCAPELLIDHPPRDAEPHALPDRPWIVFFSETTQPRQIFAYNPETDTERRLTDNDRNNGGPALDATGSRIVFNSGTDFWNLYLLDFAGGDETALVTGKHDNRWGAWSPDATRIAFESNRDGRWEIYVVEIATGDQTRLTYGAEGVWNGATDD